MDHDYVTKAQFTGKTIGESYIKDEKDEFRIGKDYTITTEAADIIESDVDDFPLRKPSQLAVKGLGESYLKEESDDYRIGKEYGVTTAADIMGSDVDDLQSDDFRKDFEEESYDDEENIKKIRESAMEVEGRRCKTQEQLDKLTKEGEMDRVKDFMADFEEDEEYYEDDYDYGEGLASSHRVRSQSILDLHYSDELGHLRERERSDTILNIDYVDDTEKSDRSVRLVPLSTDKDLDYEDSSLRVDFDYRDEISDLENEILREEPSLLAKSIGLSNALEKVVRSSNTFDRLTITDISYDRTVPRFGSRTRLENIRSCIARDPCRRVLSSDAVWLSSSPVRGKKYKSYDEMMKKRHVVRFK